MEETERPENKAAKNTKLRVRNHRWFQSQLIESYLLHIIHYTHYGEGAPILASLTLQYTQIAA